MKISADKSLMKAVPRPALSMAPRAGGATAICTKNRVAFIDQPNSADLFELMSQPELGWDDLVRNLARKIVGSSYDYPAIAIFEASPHGDACFLYGDLNVEVTTTQGELHLPVADISTWFESRISDSLVRIEVGDVAGKAVGQISNGFLDASGFVAGFDNEAFAYDNDLAAGADALVQLDDAQVEAFDPTLTTMITSEELDALKNGVREPEPEPFDPTQTTMISGTELSALKKGARKSDPQHDPKPGGSGDPDFTLPQLRGIRCGSGHLNSLQDSQCRTCGDTVDQSGSIDTGERPALAIITLDDSTQFALTTPMVLGRSVPDQYSIRGEMARSTSLTDDSNLISRVHLEIHLAGWDIELIDKGSANGTFTRPIGNSTTKTRLHPGQATAIPLGTEVEIGGRTFSVTAGPL